MSGRAGRSARCWVWRMDEEGVEADGGRKKSLILICCCMWLILFVMLFVYVRCWGVTEKRGKWEDSWLNEWTDCDLSLVWLPLNLATEWPTAFLALAVEWPVQGALTFSNELTIQCYKYSCRDKDSYCVHMYSICSGRQNWMNANEVHPWSWP